MATKKAEDVLRAELERKKRDLYKVFNPTNQDMKIVLNKKINPEEWTIRAKKVEIVPWYVANRYAHRIADKIIYAKADGAVIKENQKRMKKGFASMDLHTEQFRFESKILKGLQGKKKDLFKILIVGLHKEYGIGEKGEEPDAKQTALNMQVDQTVDDVLSGKRMETDTEKQKKSIKKIKKTEANKPKKVKKKVKKGKIVEGNKDD